MDPMDYTMDENQPNQRANAAHQYLCQQPQVSASNALAPHSRDGQHYDPVHESNGWYQANSGNISSRPSYTVQQNMPQWSPPSILPGHNSPYHGYHEGLRSTAQSQNSGGFRAGRAFLDMPWNESHGFGFGFSSLASLRSSSVTGAETGSDMSSAQQTAIHAATSSNVREAVAVTQAYQSNRLGANPNSSSPTGPLAQDDSASAERTIRYHYFPSEPSAESSPRQERIRTTVVASRISDPLDILHNRSRNPVHSGDSDEDDDPPLSHSATYSEAQRRQREIYSSDVLGVLETERQIAGAMEGKRILSKGAIESLEPVNLEGLTGSDRSCIICYNEFGIENPEGLVETPLRLPKCKHLFGDKCIRQWLEDSDSCPYCRDKLPSEFFIKKNVGYEAFRATRERMLAMSRRLRPQGIIPRFPYLEDSATGRPLQLASHRGLEDYEYMASRDSWGITAPSRSSGTDSPERRRQARGRIGSSRGNHSNYQAGRPTSIGSARPVSFTQYVPHSRPNAQVTVPVGSNIYITAALPRQSGASASSPSAHTPPRNRLLDLSPSSSSVTASAPVAVGSSSARSTEAQQERLSEMQSEIRRSSIDTWNSNHDPMAFPRYRESDISAAAHRHRPQVSSSQISNQPTLPSFGTSLSRHHDNNNS